MSAPPVAVITGGGRGIGAATARHLASAGWRPVVSYRRDATAAAAVAEETGGRALSCEVTDADAVDELFARAAELGTVSAVVVNAGIVAPQSDLADMDVERMRRVVDVNVVGALLTCRAAVRTMATSRGGPGGSVVLISSRAAQLGSAGLYVDYAATKGAVDTLVVGLAGEVVGDGIRINGVRPGIIDTEIHADSGRPDRATTAASIIPMGRAGSPDEVAAAVAWLCSTDASYVTGAVLDVGGGR